jgi:hypothetical protein
MLLVNVVVPLVYAGGNIFVAYCLLFFGEDIGDYHSRIHWGG